MSTDHPTRGHRLEGIRYAGSPAGMIINALRGIHVCVPRNMTQAAGFYNTLLASDASRICSLNPLNGYRTKENFHRIWANSNAIRIPEVLKEAKDLTIVTLDLV